MAYIAMWLPTNKYGIKSPYKMTPKGVVVHNTWNDARAINEIAYMNRNDNQISYHVAIDDVDIVQAIPFDRNAWHCGADYGNLNLIGVEVCYSRSGGTRFTNAEIQSAQYVATLCKQYGWGIDRVQTHQQQSGKYCPHRTLDLGWQRYLNLVKKYMEDGVVKNGWIQYNGNKWKYYINGSYVSNEWRKIEGAYYYFEKNGYIIQSDWLQYRQGWYWLDENGRMACKGWQQIDETWYYFTESGRALEEEWLEEKGVPTFYLQKGGSMAKGLKAIKGKEYLFGDDGRLYRGYTIGADGVLKKS